MNPEYSVSGVVASGSIDYALLYKDFAITVVEVGLRASNAQQQRQPQCISYHSLGMPNTPSTLLYVCIGQAT